MALTSTHEALARVIAAAEFLDVKQPVLTVRHELLRKPLPVVLVYLGTRENPSDSYEFTDGTLSFGTVCSLCRKALQFLVTSLSNDPSRSQYMGANVPISGLSWVQASCQLTCCYTALLENSDVPQIQYQNSQLELFMLKSRYDVEHKKYERLVELVEMKESLITREHHHVQAIWADLVARRAQFGSASSTRARELNEDGETSE